MNVRSPRRFSAADLNRSIPQVAMDGADIERMIRNGAKRDLIECDLALGRAAEAQKLTEELSKETVGVWGIDQLAGRVQGASGARTIEGEILKEEAASAETPEYWLRRGNYYTGRKENAPAAEAYEKGLALAPRQPEGRPAKVPENVRVTLLRDYTRFLMESSQADAALALIRRELTEAQPTDVTAPAAIRTLADWDQQAKRPVDPAEPLLWKYLEGHPKWDYTERRLLRVMAERTGEDQRDALWKRLTGLAGRKADPTRAASLGELLGQQGEPERAIPLLRDAAERLENADAREAATVDLYQAYSKINRLAEAEKLLPPVRKRLNSAEEVEWRGRWR
jgi:tetratricopeptide (TPR) repeat protein